MTGKHADTGRDSGTVTDGLDRRTFLGAAGAGAVATVAGCLGDDNGDVVRVGHIANVQADMGAGSENSGQLAVDELNDADGIMDQDVEFISVDSQSDPGHALTEVEGLVEQDNVDVVIGTFVTEVMQGITDYVAEMDVPFLITGSADPVTLTDTVAVDYDRYRNIFRSGPINSDFQAEASADYAEFLNDEYGWTDVALVMDDAAWTEPFSEILPGELEDRGFDVVLEDRLAPGTDDWAPVNSSIADSGADFVLRFFAHNVGTGMLVNWRENEYEFSIEGIHVPGMSPEFWDDSEGAALYETTSQSGGGGAAEMTEETMPFVDAYEAEYGDDRPSLPMYMGFNTYDAVHVYKEAVERAGTTDYQADIDVIVDELLETDHTGAAGEIEFYGEGDEYPHDVVEMRTDDGVISNFPVTQWQEGGEIECVYPLEFASADHVAPEWM
ncbi:ABC transporter substrate-binding protein [Natrarchaeobaculum aegyptiacum]|uniref:ABC transporter substrate-binding protein n=1 Tax=Natrarchaeobaculum aegyptiacum TaxID=745377 RepID=A0A2Z2HTG8_9EURY|nr:ABC transporter substrate-binding protein [Natrarchaeobaculum aegyptiacum]ARS88707.1 ABC transporter substrate-binding protein [Natrarchaeobaculum aegyptiacum]